MPDDASRRSPFQPPLVHLRTQPREAEMVKEYETTSLLKSSTIELEMS